MDLVVVPGRQTIDVNPQSPSIPSSLAKLSPLITRPTQADKIQDCVSTRSWGTE
jgi:hypothetical protein